jgi:hypothetical protein
MNLTAPKSTMPTAEEVEFQGKNMDSALLFLNNVGITSFTEDEENILVRKVDRMILPLLATVYMLQFVDKSLSNTL